MLALEPFAQAVEVEQDHVVRPVRLECFGQMSPIDTRHDVEASDLCVLAASDASISIGCRVEFVVFLGRRSIRLEVQLDCEFTLAFDDYGCETFMYIPPCFLEFGVAEQVSLGIQHLSILIDILLACILTLNVFQFQALLLLLGQMPLVVYVGAILRMTTFGAATENSIMLI